MSSQAASSPALTIRHTGQVFPLSEAPVAIGRQTDNTIVLADPQASRHHATIYWQAGSFFVEDMGSANGTYVNDRRITDPRPLRDGDVIRMGNTLFDVQLPPPARALEKPMAAWPTIPEYVPDSDRRSAWPFILGLLLAGIVVVGLAIAAFLFFDRATGTPTVTLQSPSEGARLLVGEEIIVQATATGAQDIIRLELRVDDILVGMSTSQDPDGMASLTVSQPWIFMQPGPHTVVAVAYTSRGRISEPASASIVVAEIIAQETPSPTISAPSPTAPVATSVPSATVSPTDTPVPDTPTPTPSGTPTDTPTATPTRYPPPQIEYFRADPATVIVGGCSTLRWGRVTDATMATIDQGIGGIGTPGDTTVCPSETTTYVLTAVGAGGTTTASATVTVRAAQPDLTVVSITFVPAPPVQSQDNEVRITLQNIGTAPSGPFQWEWQPGTAAPSGGAVATGLNAGQSLLVTTVWRPGSSYSNLPTVARVDVGNAVAESDENNNELQVNVQVVPPSDTTVTLYGQAALDGFQSNDGGGNNATDIRVGNGATFDDPPSELVTRGFLSFDLSGIPASATVKSIDLRFFQALVNGDPYGKLDVLLLKHVDYGPSLENADYDTAELDSSSLPPTTSPGQWYTVTSDTIIDWIEQDLAADRTRFQTRLQFSIETDGDGLEDWVGFESGDNFLGTGNVPQLTITYSP